MLRRFTRRRLLLGGGVAGVGVVALAAGMLEAGAPGRARLERLVGACHVTIPTAAVAPGPLVAGSFWSQRRRREVRYAIAYPPGYGPGDRLPLCVLLHGYGGDEREGFDALHYHGHLAEAVVRGGTAPCVLAGVEGGDGYWHPRAGGDDPMGMVLEEFLPLLGERGLRSMRPALLGWSMGGYGALLFLERQPERFAAVAASSPAIWRSHREASGANPRAFDSAADFAAHDVLAGARRLRGALLRVDCGDHDPFAEGVAALRARLPDPGAVHLEAGCHDEDFWQHCAPQQLRFLGAALTV